jgi:hypothetical protein
MNGMNGAFVDLQKYFGTKWKTDGGIWTGSAKSSV